MSVRERYSKRREPYRFRTRTGFVWLIRPLDNAAFAEVYGTVPVLPGAVGAKAAPPKEAEEAKTERENRKLYELCVVGIVSEDDPTAEPEKVEWKDLLFWDRIDLLREVSDSAEVRGEAAAKLGRVL